MEPAAAPLTAGEPTPPPAGPPPKRRGGLPVLPIVLAVIGVLAIVVVVLVLVLGGDDDGGEEGGGGGGGEAETAADELLAAIPAGVREECEGEDGSGETVATAECDLDPPGSGPGADEVTFTRFESGDDLQRAFDERVAAAPSDLDDSRDCSTFRNAVHAWDSGDTSGRVACIADAPESTSAIVWTDTEQELLGEASRPDIFATDLYRWWADAVERSDVDAFPNEAETDLLEHVPEAIRGTCVRVDASAVYPTSIAGVRCLPDGLDSVVYTQFPARSEADAAFAGVRDFENLDRDTGNPPGGTCPGESTYAQSAEEPGTRGRVMCFVDGENAARYDWVDQELSILVEAIGIAGRGARDFPVVRDFFLSSDSGPI